ncbi:hypothetical protein ACCD08_24290, partial [Telluria sp. Tellsp104]
MKTIKHIIATATLATVALGLTGCAGMSKQDRNTAIGAGAGAGVGGARTGGRAVGPRGGAAVGGGVGHHGKNTPRSRRH